MAAATGTLRHPKGTTDADPDPGLSAGAFARAYLDSSVGAKFAVGVTGVLLVGFTVAHVIGNLKMFSGPEAINKYAYFLKHDIGLLLWVARGGLLGVFVLHLFLALRLQLRARAARPVAYAHPGTVQATVASRTMMWTGIVVGLYVLFHLAHFTFGWVKPAHTPAGDVPYHALTYMMPDGKVVHDVYSMVIAGFRNPYIVVIYLISQVVLFVHLRHGIPSTFQTLGIKSARWGRPIDLLGLATALTILAGNLAIVLGVWFGYVKPLYTTG